MDIEKLFKEFVEKEWHDGHEPQGGYDHYEEDEEIEEKFEKKQGLILMQRKKIKRKRTIKRSMVENLFLLVVNICPENIVWE